MIPATVEPDVVPVGAELLPGYRVEALLSRGGRIWLSASRPQTVGGAPVWSEWTRVAGPPGRVATVSASAIVGRVGVLVAVTTDGVSHYAHYERMPGDQFDDLEWSAWTQMP